MQHVADLTVDADPLVDVGALKLEARSPFEMFQVRRRAGDEVV
jgi:hypothetical protein